MALEDKLDLLVSKYTRRQIPSLEASIRLYIQDELQRIEQAISILADATSQVANTEPESKRRGMVRYAVSPWNPLGDGTQGLVVYNGTTWVKV